MLFNPVQDEARWGGGGWGGVGGGVGWGGGVGGWRGGQKDPRPDFPLQLLQT